MKKLVKKYQQKVNWPENFYSTFILNQLVCIPPVNIFVCQNVHTLIILHCRMSAIQAVTSILEKFKKSDRLFDVNAEPEFADDQQNVCDTLTDDFDGDVCDDGEDFIGQGFHDQKEAYTMNRDPGR